MSSTHHQISAATVRAVKPFSFWRIRTDEGAATVDHVFVDGRAVYPVGCGPRRHRQKEREIRHALRKVLPDAGRRSRPPSVIVTLLVPNEHGHLNLEAAEDFAISAKEGVRLRHYAGAVAVVGRHIDPAERAAIARRLWLDETQVVGLSEDHRSLGEAAAHLVAPLWS